MPSERLACSVDVVIVSPRNGELAVLLRRARGTGQRGGRELPWADAGSQLRPTAARLAREVMDIGASRLEQLRAYDSGHPHPSGQPLSVAFRAIAPEGTPVAHGADWVSVARLPTVARRQRAMVEDAVAELRGRRESTPLAFQLVPDAFTLSELQRAYELLLGRPLHKASFRRALSNARLVRAAGGSRSEGPGRPARLFRYAPAHRRPLPRGIPFPDM